MKLGNFKIFFLCLFLIFSNPFFVLAEDKIESVPLINLEELSPTFEEDKTELEKMEDKNIILDENDNISSDSKSKILVFRKYSSETILKKNSHGVNEPFNELDLNANSLDTVLVPLVAYDKEGYRIGMGGGYYDSTFHQQNEKKTLKLIGLAYQFQKEDSCVPEQHDINLDDILSPKGFESFRNLF